MLSIRHQLRCAMTACLGLAGVVLLVGCAEIPVGRMDPRISTGRVYTKAEICRLMPRVFVGDEAYAEVNSRELDRFYQEFSAELHRLGIAEGDNRLNSKRLVELYTGVAQAKFYRQSFQSDTPARALALGPFWYVDDGSKDKHAVVQVLTERGPIYIDPRTGQQVILTVSEKASVFLQVM